MDGVEAFYLTHDQPADRAAGRAAAAELDMLTTGSADFHGPENRAVLTLHGLRHVRPRAEPRADRRRSLSLRALDTEGQRLQGQLLGHVHRQAQPRRADELDPSRRRAGDASLRVLLELARGDRRRGSSSGCALRRRTATSRSHSSARRRPRSSVRVRGPPLARRRASSPSFSWRLRSLLGKQLELRREALLRPLAGCRACCLRQLSSPSHGRFPVSPRERRPGA
jgi:hypothetical protein